MRTIRNALEAEYLAGWAAPARQDGGDRQAILLLQLEAQRGQVGVEMAGVANPHDCRPHAAKVQSRPQCDIRKINLSTRGHRLENF